MKNQPITNRPAAGRELSSAELDQVNGGLVVIAIIAVMIGLLTPEVRK